MRKMTFIFVVAIVLCGMISSCTNGVSEKETKKSLMIEVPVPERPAGQKDVVNLVTPKLDTVRVGFIGLGMRGPGAVERFLHIPGTKVVALCDIRPEQVEKCQGILKKAGVPEAVGYSGREDAWKQLCERDDINLVYIATDWLHHAPMALYAMEHGKHVAIEVPAAMNMEEIWALINMAEKKQLHCMMLENCVYDFFELTTLNMAQQGVFGEVLHVEGAYIHNLEEFWPYYWNNWRMDYNRKHRGDIYATHGMGPACQLLDIHRGDKMNYLVCMDTKAVSAPEYLKNKTGEEVKDFKNGDHTITLIRTENGKTIQIQHDVVSPRPYSRMYQLTGTKGFANKYPVSGYALKSTQISSDVAPDHEDLNSHGFVPEDVKKALMENINTRFRSSWKSKPRKWGDMVEWILSWITVWYIACEMDYR